MSPLWLIQKERSFWPVREYEMAACLASMSRVLTKERTSNPQHRLIASPLIRTFPGFMITESSIFGLRVPSAANRSLAVAAQNGAKRGTDVRLRFTVMVDIGMTMISRRGLLTLASRALC